jgi:sulfur dioxygenase
MHCSFEAADELTFRYHIALVASQFIPASLDALRAKIVERLFLQGGSASTLYDSIHTQLFSSLPDSCTVYPAHDYAGRPCSTIHEEKTLNPRLTKTKEEFCELMGKLNLPPPKQLDRAVPANLNCGVF